MLSATAAGPMLHWLVPSRESVAVGRVNVGPAPQMSLPGFAGDRKNVGLRSPSPKALSSPGNSDGWLMMGMMVRVMRFQSSVSLSGITGCTLRT